MISYISILALQSEVHKKIYQFRIAEWKIYQREYRGKNKAIFLFSFSLHSGHSVAMFFKSEISDQAVKAK
jgi:hypothetical protein